MNLEEKRTDLLNRLYDNTLLLLHENSMDTEKRQDILTRAASVFAVNMERMSRSDKG